jgi:hypothetical protein
MSICSFGIRGSDLTWDVSSQPCSRDNFCGRKNGAILEMGYLSPHLRVKPPYWSMLKFLAPPTKFGAQQPMLRRIPGRGLRAWRGIDSTMGTDQVGHREAFLSQLKVTTQDLSKFNYTVVELEVSLICRSFIDFSP